MKFFHWYIFFNYFWTSGFSYIFYRQEGLFVTNRSDLSTYIVQSENEILVNLKIEAPKLRELGLSDNEYCSNLTEKFQGNENFKQILGKQYFLHKLREFLQRDFDPIIRDQIFTEYITNSKRAIKNSTWVPNIENLIVKPEIEENSSSIDHVIPPLVSPNVSTSLEPSNNSVVEDSLINDLNSIHDALEAEKIKKIVAKHPLGNVLLAFDKNLNTSFEFKNTPISSNNKIYRSLQFETLTNVKLLEIYMDSTFVFETGPYANIIINQVQGTGRSSSSRLCKFREKNIAGQLIKKFIFQCHSTESVTRYLISFRFDEKEDMSRIYEIKLIPRESGDKGLNRSKRQFGELLLGGVLLGGGALMGYEANSHGGSSIEQENSVVNSDFNVIVKNEQKNFRNLENEICALSYESEEEFLSTYLNKIFLEFINQIQFLLLSNTINLKENRILESVTKICQSHNPRTFEKICETYLFGTNEIRLKNMVVSDENLLEQTNVAIILKISAKIPIFEPLIDKIFQISDVPICTNFAEPFEFQKYLLPKFFAKQGSRFISLTPCVNYEKIFFCRADKMAEVFRDNVCLNSLMSKSDINCPSFTFISEFDCYFQLIDENLLLVSSTGDAWFYENPMGTRNSQGSAIRKTKLDKIDLINFSEPFRIHCNKSSFTGDLLGTSVNISYVDQSIPAMSVGLEKNISKVANFSNPKIQELSTVNQNLKPKNFFEQTLEKLETEYGLWSYLLIPLFLIAVFLTGIASLGLSLVLGRALFAYCVQLDCSECTKLKGLKNNKILPQDFINAKNRDLPGYKSDRQIITSPI